MEQKWLWEKQGEKCVKALMDHGFDAHFVSTVEEARDLVLNMVSGYETFGFGGSHTTRSLGVKETLQAKGKTLFDHWEGNLFGEENRKIRLQQGRSGLLFLQCQCHLRYW